LLSLKNGCILDQKIEKMFRGRFESTIDAQGRIDLSPFFEELKKYKKYILFSTKIVKTLFKSKFNRTGF